MPRIADALERESRTVDLEPGDFERLLDRREREIRNRRIRAGALGVIVALAVGLALIKSVTSEGMPADQPRPVPAAAGTLAYVLDGDVYLADPDGSNAVKIEDGRSADDCYGWSGEYWAEGSMWSPDGRYLAYRRFTDCGSDDSPRPRDVVISDAEGNVLASFPAQGWDIRWSPDSTRVAVWDTFGETIGVYGPDGSRQARLAMPTWWSLPGDYDPSWTPDGTSLIVPSLVGHNVEYDVELPLDGGTPRRLPEGGRIYSPAGSYAPDGSGYVVVDDRALKVIRTDGSGSVTLLTAGRGTDLGEIGFSPEGDRVLFWKSKDGESSLWSVGVDGSDPQLVVAGTTQGQWLVR